MTASHAQVTSAAEDRTPATPAVVMDIPAVPSTQPAPDAAMPALPPNFDHPGGSARDTQFLRPHMGPGQGRGTNRFEPVSTTEWVDISAFMKHHSPKRWAFYNSLSDDRRKSVMGMVATRSYRNLQKAIAEEPKLGAVFTERVEAEDTVFGTVTAIRKARRAGNAAATATLTSTLHDEIADLTVVNFKERQLRIELLQKTIDDLKTRLAADQHDRDGVIEDRFRSALEGQHFTQPGEQPASDAGQQAAPPVDPAEVADVDSAVEGFSSVLGMAK